MKAIAMRRLMSAAVLATAAATSGSGVAYAQDSVPMAAAENSQLTTAEIEAAVERGARRAQEDAERLA